MTCQSATPWTDTFLVTVVRNASPKTWGFADSFGNTSKGLIAWYSKSSIVVAPLAAQRWSYAQKKLQW